MNVNIQKLKILIVHNYYQIPGGEDSVVENERKMLEDKGHSVIVYTRHNSEINKFNLLQKAFLAINTIFSYRTYQEVKRIVRKSEIDIVHVHNTLSLVSPAVYYAAFNCKVPVIQTIHNFRLLCPGATFYRDGHICEECVQYGLQRAVKYNCYRNSKVQSIICVTSTIIHRLLNTYKKINYICLTEFNKSKLEQISKYIDNNRIFVKPNTVNRLDSVISYLDRENQFVFVGRLDKLKGIDILLEAWRLMGEKAPKLIVVGTGPEAEWCSSFIKLNNLDNIELAGYLSNNLARELIAKSKALILPTKWYEGFPMSILEAYASGTPVIGSNIGNVGDLIEDRKTGYLFNVNSPESLIEAVYEVGDCVNAVLKKYEENYTSESNYKLLNQIYCEVNERL